MKATTDWDVLLKELFDGIPPKGCRCPNCTGRGRPVVDRARWRDRFVTPTWSPFRAMANLGIYHQVEDPAGFMAQTADGASCGDSGIWLRPDAYFPLRTAAHELTHQVLGHDQMLMKLDEKDYDRVYRGAELEADSAAAIVSHTLGYPDGPAALPSIRQYVWNYVPIDKVGVPDNVRERIKEAAGIILAAGYRNVVGILPKAA